MDLATEKAKKSGIGWVSAGGELEPGERGRSGGGGGGRREGEREDVEQQSKRDLVLLKIIVIKIITHEGFVKACPVGWIRPLSVSVCLCLSVCLSLSLH